MAKELLAIPEEHLLDVIGVIREGLCGYDCPESLAEYLNEWCDAEEGYMLSLGEDDDDDDEAPPPQYTYPDQKL